jgi:hypothetical protein
LTKTLSKLGAPGHHGRLQIMADRKTFLSPHSGFFKFQWLLCLCVIILVIRGKKKFYPIIEKISAEAQHVLWRL